MRKAIKRLHAKQKALSARHHDDAAKADKAKESVMDLESKAGALEEKATEWRKHIQEVERQAGEAEMEFADASVQSTIVSAGSEEGVRIAATFGSNRWAFACSNASRCS